MPNFAQKLISWYQKNGRKHLPWQKEKTRYRVYVSEIMLQQTQVTTVIPYFERFMQRYPTLKELAESHLDEVLSLWSGLGYYARARNLHKTAQMVLQDHAGILPDTIASLITLPGIGRSTAGAILSLSETAPAPILDGNVKRVLSRYHGLELPITDKKAEQMLWQWSEKYTPKAILACSQFNQAMMDLGATLCTRTKPNCVICPLKKSCYAYQHDKVVNFPVKRKSKTLPAYDAHFLVIQNKERKILLEQRANRGIWGGLWTLPEYRDSEPQNIKTWCQKRFHISCQSLTPLYETFAHRFTHFQLNITPMLIQANTKKSAAKKAAPSLLNQASNQRIKRLKSQVESRLNDEVLSYKWVSSTDLKSLGLPKPTERILNYFYEHLK